MNFVEDNLDGITERIKLIPKKSIITSEELKMEFSGKTIFACDFSVEGAEKGELKTYGLEYQGIINVDHHSPIPEMRRRVSSTIFALRYGKLQGSVEVTDQIVINHTDCDSILTSMILGGYLPLEDRFGHAAISADHSGEEHKMADLLQAIEEERDICFSAQELYRFLKGEPISDKANFYIEKRYAERDKVKKLVEDGKIQFFENIAYVVLEQKIDAALLLPFLPEAVAIVLAAPMKDSNKWNIKVRLGKNAPEGIYLNELSLPNFGGRWNAGSTERSGGTPLNAQQYAKLLYNKIS